MKKFIAPILVIIVAMVALATPASAQQKDSSLNWEGASARGLDWETSCINIPERFAPLAGEEAIGFHESGATIGDVVDMRFSVSVTSEGSLDPYFGTPVRYGVKTSTWSDSHITAMVTCHRLEVFDGQEITSRDIWRIKKAGKSTQTIRDGWSVFGRRTGAYHYAPSALIIFVTPQGGK